MMSIYSGVCNIVLIKYVPISYIFKKKIVPVLQLVCIIKPDTPNTNYEYF